MVTKHPRQMLPLRIRGGLGLRIKDLGPPTGSGVMPAPRCLQETVRRPWCVQRAPCTPPAVVFQQHRHPWLLLLARAGASSSDLGIAVGGSTQMPQVVQPAGSPPSR
jgi:hypothetical protein